ncbi:gamma-glutamylcyclotransferase [Neobacillus sp. YIM B06451]|uniref:gamma-glutamylcyclotransferase n=1 Tax=Neobacillus sp. YIM B06451 TaxID=3070994 RepID=UPI002931513B|nr:gamma-glutamylcyclotransferase [Neobacillus sp. YIM B06451]
MVKVFVYGTLRKGESNHHLLKNAVRIAEQCWTNGALFDTGYGYPALGLDPQAKVFGELYEVTAEELFRLDRLEGYVEGGTNNLYERVEQLVYTDKGAVTAYLYYAGGPDLLVKRIPNGDWKEYRLIARKTGSVLYFAYGSCMDDRRFRKDGVGHYFQEMLGKGVLENYTVRFSRKSSVDGRGRADIVEEGGVVEGKVYNIPIRALREYLYRREGAPFAYRPTFVTVGLNGKEVEALTFVVTDKQEEMAPPEWYKEEIIRGAVGFVSEAYFTKIKLHMETLETVIGGQV